MGIEEFYFASEIPEHFSCSICLNVAYPPVKTICNHLFCYDCLKEWIQRDCSCPLDRIQLSEILIDKQMLVLLEEELEMRCENFAFGCKWTGNMKRRSIHVDEDCLFQTVKCPHKNCEFKCMRHEMLVHQPCCDLRLVSCDYCLESIPFKYLLVRYTFCY
jgi:hypothetical protein